jgi:DNA-binding MarR family transcriptional regulator
MPRMSQSFDFAHAPGHLIRRAQQIAVSVFAERMSSFGVTPVQFAVLNALMDTPGIDQVTLSGRVAFDAATSGSVIGRLESKGWIRREADAKDRRRKLLWLTRQGERATLKMKPEVTLVQNQILDPLDADEQKRLMELLLKLVKAQSSN